MPESVWEKKGQHPSFCKKPGRHRTPSGIDMGVREQLGLNYQREAISSHLDSSSTNSLSLMDIPKVTMLLKSTSSAGCRGVSLFMFVISWLFHCMLCILVLKVPLSPAGLLSPGGPPWSMTNWSTSWVHGAIDHGNHQGHGPEFVYSRSGR